MWCTSIPSLDPQTSHTSAKSRFSSSVLGLMYLVVIWSSISAHGWTTSGMPPKNISHGALPSRSSTYLRHVLGPSGVFTVALYFCCILTTLLLYLQASVLSSEVSIIQCSLCNHATFRACL